jgi:hypothetical protein
MAIIDTHFWLSAGVAAVPVSALGGSTEVVVAAALVAGYFGAKADLDGFLAGIKDIPKKGLKGSYRWDIYTKLHKEPGTWLKRNPFFMLHLWVDKHFHDPARPGWNWWPEKWAMDVGLRVIGIGMVVVSILTAIG